MENEKDQKLGEWYYNKDYEIPAIVIHARVQDLRMRKWSNKIEFMVDTGYDGDILLSADVFMVLGYDNFTIPKQEWGKAHTVSGEVLQLSTTKSIIEINNHEFEIIIESEKSIDENLIGRKFLHQFTSRCTGNLFQIFQE